MFDPRVLKILACPICAKASTKPKPAGKLKPEGPADAPTGFTCVDCKRLYPMVDGIPDFVVK